MFWVELTLQGYEDAMILCFHFYLLSRTSGKRSSGWERLPSLLWYLFQSTIRKLLDDSYVQSSFPTIRTYFDNRIWNDAIQLNILRTWISIGTNYFLSKVLKMKIDKIARKIMYILTRACSMENIAPRNFTYYCVLLFLLSKPSL